jgi:L-rhamnose isomerase
MVAALRIQLLDLELLGEPGVLAIWLTDGLKPSVVDRISEVEGW